MSYGVISKSIFSFFKWYSLLSYDQAHVAWHGSKFFTDRVYRKTWLPEGHRSDPNRWPWSYGGWHSIRKWVFWMDWLERTQCKWLMWYAFVISCLYSLAVVFTSFLSPRQKFVLACDVAVFRILIFLFSVKDMFLFIDLFNVIWFIAGHAWLRWSKIWKLDEKYGGNIQRQIPWLGWL